MVAEAMTDLLKFHSQPEMERSSMVVGWSDDAGRLGGGVIDYLNRKLGSRLFCEIEPVSFFPLGGVAVEDDVVQFPESRFYACSQHELATFKSNPPAAEWTRFAGLIVDVAEKNCHMREMHTISGMVALSAHTAPRQMIATFNSNEIKEEMQPYNLTGSIDYETPPGQRPTLNTVLLWSARRRNIPGIGLWVPVPFYLAGLDDPLARRKVVDFYNRRFSLGLDLSDLDEEVARQFLRLAEARSNSPQIEESISKLENDRALTDEESLRLINDIEKVLKNQPV
jgi:predicted ATP-grasp superfamily ATP-dependent carboligase